LTLYVGTLVPLSLMVEGGALERSIVALHPWRTNSETRLSHALSSDRRLNLSEAVFLAKPLTPEARNLLSEGEWQTALSEAEPIKSLESRSLRHAQLNKAILVGVDLRGAQLQGADLSSALLQGAKMRGAQLQDADLSFALLQGADMSNAQLRDAHMNYALLQGANMRGAQLQGADLHEAQLQDTDLSPAELQGANSNPSRLQGANLRGALLQGTDLSSAQLQGTDLSYAQLQGADLSSAQLPGTNLFYAMLQGTDLSYTQLQGADLGYAQLQGADLSYAQLQGANLVTAQLQGADLRNAGLYAVTGPIEEASWVDGQGAEWQPLSAAQLAKLQDLLEQVVYTGENAEELKRASVESLKRLKDASKPGASILQLTSCLAPADTPLHCKKRFDPSDPQENEAFKKKLQKFLTDLACTSLYVARAMVHKLPNIPESSSRKGLSSKLVKLVNDPDCPGLRQLSADEKHKLHVLANTN
jgi:uncharacterized protein YjbI with pentapeptide repeats